MNRSFLVAALCVWSWVAGCKDKPPPRPVAVKQAPVETPPAVAAPVVAPVPSWQSLETATFTIEVPGVPVVKEGIEKTNAGSVNTTTWSVQTSAAFYAVSLADYPKGMMAKAIPSQVLEGARDGAMANIGGTVDKDVVVFLDSGTPKKKYPGREFDGSTGQGIQLAARLFLVGDRLYQMISVSPKASFNAVDFKQFADSFKLKATPTSAAKSAKRSKK